jgi:hypothetical protein
MGRVFAHKQLLNDLVHALQVYDGKDEREGWKRAVRAVARYLNGGCCFGPLDSRSGSRQFLIGEIDQIHKMDRVSKVTSVGVFRQGCLHHEGRAFIAARRYRHLLEPAPRHGALLR